MIQKFETSLSKIRKHSAVDNRRTGAYNDAKFPLRGAASHASHVFPPQERRSRDHVRGRLCMLCGEYRQQQHPSAYHRHCACSVDFCYTQHSGHRTASRTNQTGICGISTTWYTRSRPRPFWSGPIFCCIEKRTERKSVMEKKKVGFALSLIHI